MSRSEAGRLGGIKNKELKVSAYVANPNLCSFCKSILVYEKRHNKFCGHSCSARFNNPITAKHETDGLYKKKSCLNCGNTTENIKFCSRACCSSYDWIEFKKKIEQDNRMPNTKHTVGFNADLAKKYLIEKYGRQCSICKIEHWQNQPVPLVLDHINGNPTDHSLSNFRLVCGNCDMQLPTYKSKNIGYGRKYRRVFRAVIKE